MPDDRDTRQLPQTEQMPYVVIKPDAPKIENIEIIELLGRGGMSLVYKARQTQLDRIVAVKALSKVAIHEKDGIRRFHKVPRMRVA